MRDVMIDLETLSTRPDAAIVAIGAVAFGPEGTGTEYYRVIRPSEIHGHIDPETVAWWMRQGDEARAIFGVDAQAVSLGMAVAGLGGFLAEDGRLVRDMRVWGHGSSFDIPIVESAFRAAYFAPPWGHRAPRDTRTILELAGIKVEMPANEKHNALSDARAQALAVIKAATILGAERLWPELAGTA